MKPIETKMETFTKAPAEFTTLIDGAYKKVYDMAFRLSGNRQDAEDLTQEACLRAYKGFQSFEGDRPFLNWMYRIVTRLFLDMRRNRRRRITELSLDAPIPSFFGDDVFFEPADARRNPEQQLMCDLLNGELQDALNSLSPTQRALVQMVDLDEIDHKAAAIAISRVEGTVRTRLHRAHRQMQDRMTRRAARKSLLDGPPTQPIIRRGKQPNALSQLCVPGSIAELAAQLAILPPRTEGTTC